MREGLAKLKTSFKYQCPTCPRVKEYRFYSEWLKAETTKRVCKYCHSKRMSMLNNTTKESNPAWRGYKGVGNAWFSKYFQRKQRKRTGTITIQDAYNKLEAQGFKCALSGVPLEWSETSGMSIDRIDSKREYEIDNIQLVHKDINLMKNHFDEDYFIEMCRKISIYRQ